MDHEPLRLLVANSGVADTDRLTTRLQQCPSGSPLVTSVATSTDAIERLDAEPFDCVLIDDQFDGQAGLALIRNLRATGNDVPIVMMASASDEPVAAKALAIGAQGFVEKNTATSARLCRAIGAACEQIEASSPMAAQQEEMQDFAHATAHDLRAPLASFEQNVGSLRHEIDGNCTSEADELLQRLEAGASRMSRMLDALLEFTWLGRASRAVLAVDLNLVVSMALANLDCDIRAAGAAVRVRSLPTVIGDGDSLVQLFQNLIANAVKFRSEGSPGVYITAKCDDGWVTISVADNGIGIPPEHQESVFQPFHRIHPRSVYDGSGIGLATCRRIVDQHDGRIWIESAVGRGTAMHFTLAALPPNCRVSPWGATPASQPHAPLAAGSEHSCAVAHASQVGCCSGAS